jgi:hypothetical protein
LQAPAKFCNILFSLFNHRNLFFFSPFGSYNIRSTFTGLPQGSCLNPLLFNIYEHFQKLFNVSRAPMSHLC